MYANRNDRLTVAAIGLIAMCVVTADHEALGHGGVCLLLHGHIVLLTSSLFRCSVGSGWIDAGGPAANLLVGVLALLLRTAIPTRFPNLRLFLLLVTALSFFWEGGYLIKAMLDRNGDLYDFARFVLGETGPWFRLAGGIAGLMLYLSAARLASRALLEMWTQGSAAREVARTVWLTVTIAAALGGAAYAGHDWGNFRDAALEIGVASLPLLFVPSGRSSEFAASPTAVIARSYPTLFLALAVYAAFLATLGRGIVSQVEAHQTASVTPRQPSPEIVGVLQALSP